MSSKLIEDLSNPLEIIRKELITLVETLTKIRRIVKHPGREGLFPEKSRNEGMPIEDFMKEIVELSVAREEFEEHVSNLLARLHECRAHAALANKALAKIIELSQPKVSKGELS